MTQPTLIPATEWSHQAERPFAAGLGQVPRIPVMWIVSLVIASACLVGGMMKYTGIIIAVANLGFFLSALAVVTLAALRCAAHRPSSLSLHRLRDFSEHMLMFVAVCLLGVIATYPAAAETRGFVDPTLARMDQFLHFDWIAWYQTVQAYPLLRAASAVAYASIYVSPIVLLGYCAWTHRGDHARRFILTFWTGTVITLALFTLFPAEGPLAYLWHGPIPYMPTSALYQEQMIPALRSHQLTAIDMSALRGLVCAPSFHTVSGVLYMTAAWPLTRLRWPLLATNCAMLLATPVEGTHYLVDMIAGLAVALAALALVKYGLHHVHKDAPARA